MVVVVLKHTIAFPALIGAFHDESSALRWISKQDDYADYFYKFVKIIERES